MIWTLFRIAWANLRRDRVAQALTFLLPVMFFSILASVFGNQRNTTNRITIALVDEDRSEFSQQLVKALEAEGGLRVTARAGTDGQGEMLDRAGAEALVRKGSMPVAVILPKGLGGARRFWNQTPGSQVTVQLLADVSDPVAPQVVMGLLQKDSFTAAPELMATEGLAMFEKYSGPLTPAQRQSVETWTAEMKRERGSGGAAKATNGTQPAAFGLPVEIVNVMQPGQGMGTTVAFSAAGIGVMFLLFSCAGSGGSLLEEEESGTLGRLVSSRAGMGGVLAGKWLFLTSMGILQLTVMFTWGAVMFRLPLWSHLPGFFVMTFFTAAAAAGFGLVLATLSRSRAQLSGISTIVILTMSAIGGSMFPRFLMSETMQKAGLVTFNAWALDGYLKVFWREAPIGDLWPQVVVLSVLATAFMFVARMLARRWETL